MGWRLGGALMLAALLAGCADISDRFAALGSSHYTMARAGPGEQLEPQTIGGVPAGASLQSSDPPPRGKFGVQIAAPRSEADARAVIDAMRAKHASLIGREWASIHRVELPNGVFYRVLIGPMATEQQASQLCSSLKAQGSPCFIRGT